MFESSLPDECEGFVPQPCISYINCTMTEFRPNWTEFCCQPTSVRNTRSFMLSVLGIVIFTGTVCNIITILTFFYLYFFPQRIKRKFNQEFTMTEDPVFLLILHLSICDFLHCIAGLPTYWSVYYYGYFPYSDNMCKYSAFFRNTIAFADFSTLAVISAYFAWRRGQERPRNKRFGHWPVFGVILSIWVYSFCISFINLFKLCGEIGYDAVHGICHTIDCGKCSEESTLYLPAGAPLVILGIGLPFVVIIISYSLVYKKLTELAIDVETWSQKRAVIILGLCYFVFILPLCVSELLPETVAGRAFFRAIIYSWYWLVYVVNFFIYIIFWRRVRTAVRLMLRDIMGLDRNERHGTNDPEITSSHWWTELQSLTH